MVDVTFQFSPDKDAAGYQRLTQLRQRVQINSRPLSHQKPPDLLNLALEKGLTDLALY
jgi:hypothetical protein